MVLKKITGGNRVTNASISNLIKVKNGEILKKIKKNKKNKKNAETFNNYFVNIVPNLNASIHES